jgi:hypothetical protein
MRAIFENMEKQGQIGPFMKQGDTLVPRPNWRAEYPKWVTKADGTKCIVKDVNEEMLAVGQHAPPSDVVDPLAEEKRKLLEATEANLAKSRELEEELTKARAMMAEIAAEREASAARTSKYKPQISPQAKVQAEIEAKKVESGA